MYEEPLQLLLEQALFLQRLLCQVPRERGELSADRRPRCRYRCCRQWREAGGIRFRVGGELKSCVARNRKAVMSGYWFVRAMCARLRLDGWLAWRVTSLNQTLCGHLCQVVMPVATRRDISQRQFRLYWRSTTKVTLIDGRFLMTRPRTGKRTAESHSTVFLSRIL